MSSEKSLPSLPVVFEEKVLTANPMFAELMSLLETKLTPAGISRDLDNQHQMAKLNLEREREPYIQNLLLLTELENLSISSRINADAPAVQKHQRLLGILTKVLTVGKSLEHLRISATAEEGLLGLTKEDLESMVPKDDRTTLLQMKDITMQLLDDQLLLKGEELLQFFSPIVKGISSARANGQDTKFSYTHVAQLQSTVTTALADLQQESLALASERRILDAAFLDLHRTLAQTLSYLAQIVSEHKLQHTPKHEKVVALWLQARCSTMFMKLNKMKKEYLLETYTQSSVPALQQIRDHLLAEQDKLADQFANSTKKLHEYLSLGSGFEALSSQYAALLEEIKNKEWALSQLQT